MGFEKHSLPEKFIEKQDTRDDDVGRRDGAEVPAEDEGDVDLDNEPVLDEDDLDS